MGWTFTDDLATYGAVAEPLLRTDPVENTVPLTVIENSRHQPNPDESYGWWTEPDGRITGVISHTSPHPVLLCAVPEHAVRPLVDSGRLVGGISGESRLAAYCGAVWTRTTGGTAQLRAAHRLFRLEELTLPAQPDGRGRPATDADLDFLVAAHEGFHRESTGAHDSSGIVTAVKTRLEFGGLWLWENGAGDPVAMAGFGREAAGAVRVAPVYTSPSERGRGYGSAVTASVSRHLQGTGAQILLFTDLTNPTSNSIYQKIGYRPVSDRLMLDLVP
ncbi:MAG TPA: GNAT family N-acetyltransferase [Mycobacteriales bacterium]|nr:GNAT family N-acetyltransferase [Mycobacteriales bacterium]